VPTVVLILFPILPEVRAAPGFFLSFIRGTCSDENKRRYDNYIQDLFDHITYLPHPASRVLVYVKSFEVFWGLWCYFSVTSYECLLTF